MTDKEYFKKLLDIKQPMSEKPNRFSTIVLLIKSARKLFGCDLETGTYKMSELNEENFINGTYQSFQFTGLINYLILLEQLGSIFKPKDQIKLIQTNGIFCSLKYYSNLSDDKIQAIKSLRNSLTHKFGLATEKKPNIGKPRKFIISIENNPEIINLPKDNWDGNFNDKSDNTSTIIYAIELVKIIESIYQKIIEDNNSENLELVLEDGIPELNSRYTITE
jgi:hypothetical protein